MPCIDARTSDGRRPRLASRCKDTRHAAPGSSHAAPGSSHAWREWRGEVRRACDCMRLRSRSASVRRGCVVGASSPSRGCMRRGIAVRGRMQGLVRRGRMQGLVKRGRMQGLVRNGWMQGLLDPVRLVNCKARGADGCRRGLNSRLAALPKDRQDWRERYDPDRLSGRMRGCAGSANHNPVTEPGDSPVTRLCAGCITRPAQPYGCAALRLRGPTAARPYGCAARRLRSPTAARIRTVRSSHGALV